MKNINIYLIGVGGQGIGLLSEILLRAADHAGWNVKGVDTHGLAQRGGVVVSQIRMGESVNTPLIRKGSADLVVSLERHEALRGASEFLRDGGDLVYYDTVWQPLPVRLGETAEVTSKDIEKYAAAHGMTVFRVHDPALSDPRMQNVALLHALSRKGLVEDLSENHYISAMKDLMNKEMLKRNMELFESEKIQMDIKSPQ